MYRYGYFAVLLLIFLGGDHRRWEKLILDRVRFVEVLRVLSPT